MRLTGLMPVNIIIVSNGENTSTVFYERYYHKGKRKNKEIYWKGKFWRYRVQLHTVSDIRQAQDGYLILPDGIWGGTVQWIETVYKNVSDKTFSSNLKELEKNRLIIRKEYPQIPPKVEYSLSERGKSLINDVNLRRHYPYVLQIYPYVKPIRCSVMLRYPFEAPIWTNDWPHFLNSG